MMTQLKKFQWKCMFFFVVCCLQESNGSSIILESSGNFIPMLTTTTTLRCSLNDSANALGPAGLVGRRDVNSTSDNVHIEQIVITRGIGRHVASITTFSRAQGFMDQEKMVTKGQINGLPGQERGYLEVIWTYPSKDQVADYKCEIFGVSTTGAVKFTKSLSLETAPPSIDALVQHVHATDLKNDALQGKVDLLINQNQNLADNITNLRKENQELKTQVANLATHTPSSSGKLHHIETGQDDCVIRPDDTDDYDDGEFDFFHTVDFDTPYEKDPIVYVSMHGSDLFLLNGSITRPDYLVEVHSVNKQSFEVRCYISAEAYDRGYLFFSWLSLPSP